MLSTGVIIGSVMLYMGILFAIAYYGDKRADENRSIICNPYIYALSIAVYCTAWTFFGSVGRAASTGVGFLPIYLGPTLMAALWWFVLRKMTRIAKEQRISSIADFIGSRYGKSGTLTGLVTVIAVVGILPYISLQLKAIATSYFIVRHYPELVMPAQSHSLALWEDTAFYVTLFLAAFTILFGTRHVDVTERHEGMVAAIAFESIIKLIAFLALGIYVSYGLFDGPDDIFTQAIAIPEMAKLMSMEAMPGGYASWFSLTIISMCAVLFLPRQFQVAVVENVDEEHIRKASWLFPLYLLLINLFVLPLAFGGLLLFPEGGVDPDTFVLTIPMAQQNELLTLFVFIGGVSAATGMVIVATIALSTMISNELVMPALLRSRVFAASHQGDLTGIVLGIRRGAIVVILFLAYLYFRLIGESYALVSIGLVSFVAAAQFAPAILIGMFWKGANRMGALAGLSCGFVIWAYTLVLPAIVKSGWLPISIIEQGPFGLEVFRPYNFLGLSDLDPITHAVFWSLPANVFMLVVVSLFTRSGVIERLQASIFVDVFTRSSLTNIKIDVWRGSVLVSKLQALVGRFIGEKAAKKAFVQYAKERGFDLNQEKFAEPQTHLASHAEHLLAGVIGAASARVMVSSLYEGKTLNIDDVMEILDETSQVMEYSHQLELKTEELQKVTEELRDANEQLKELDRLKDEFVSTVSHELRTPLTSIRAFSEILLGEPEMQVEERQKYLQIVVTETERLTRLINDVLDLAKIESGNTEWQMEEQDLCEVIEEATNSVSQIYQNRIIDLSTKLPAEHIKVLLDRDHIMQVLLNLLSNAAKFCEPKTGRVGISVSLDNSQATVCVEDNGPGIDYSYQATIFDKFRQVQDQQKGKPKGSGLGLAICRPIIEHHNGRLWLESKPGQGSRFYFSLPLK